MKRLTIVAIIGLLSFAFAANAMAGIDRFLGTWNNVDPNTGGITKVQIFQIGSNVYVHAWGKCHPTDCDWGSVMVRGYGPDVSADLMPTMHAISAVYVKSFATSVLTIHPHPVVPELIEVESFTKFTDNSGRTAYSAKYTMERVPALAIPRQLSPLDGSVFSHYPRVTTLRWLPVPGAVSYTIEVDCFHCCESGKWCTDIGETWKIVPNLHGTAYTFSFVGAQPGRWRVWAVDANGNTSAKSDWWEFRYTR